MTIETALLVGSMVTSTVGALSSAGAASAQAEAAANAAQYKQSVARRNQQIAEQKRQLALQQARIDAEDKRRENRRKLSEIRASYGASGIDLAGSPLDVLEDSALELELDARRIQHAGQVKGYEGALQILGLQDEATLAGIERQSALSRAKSATRAGYISAVGGLVRGGADIAGSEYGKSQGWS